MSIRDIMKDKGVEGPPLLHGSDLPNKVTSVKIVVEDIRPGPDNFNSIAIIDLAKEVHGCKAWAVNKTNMKALLEKADLDEDCEIEELAAKLKGKTIKLSTARVNNPQTKKMVLSLFID